MPLTKAGERQVEGGNGLGGHRCEGKRVPPSQVHCLSAGDPIHPDKPPNRRSGLPEIVAGIPRHRAGAAVKLKCRRRPVTTDVVGRRAKSSSSIRVLPDGL
jgi:hypothetical protein